MIKTVVPLMFRIIAVVFLLTVAVFLQCEKAVAATEDDEIAGTAAPAPVYRVTGKVLSMVKKVEIHEDRYNPSSPKRKFTYYQVRMKIFSMAYISDPSGAHKPGEVCPASQIAEAEKVVYIVFEEQFSAVKLAAGQKIEGSTSFRGDESFHGNFLSDIRVTGR
ncbi:MAG: hypothetical protein AB9903_31130 [Vulcanimicrobiota bacterium]